MVSWNGTEDPRGSLLPGAVHEVLCVSGGRQCKRPQISLQRAGTCAMFGPFGGELGCGIILLVLHVGSSSLEHGMHGVQDPRSV